MCPSGGLIAIGAGPCRVLKRFRARTLFLTVFCAKKIGVVGRDHAGPVWHGNRPKAGNEKKNTWKTTPSWTKAKEGLTMDVKGIFDLFFHFRVILDHFCPCPIGVVFFFGFCFASVSSFRAFSLPYRPGMIPILGQNLANRSLLATALHLQTHLPLVNKSGQNRGPSGLSFKAPYGRAPELL